MTSVADDSMELEAFVNVDNLQQQIDNKPSNKQMLKSNLKSKPKNNKLDLAMKTILTPDTKSSCKYSLVDSTKADVLKRQLVGLDQQKISIPVNDEQLRESSEPIQKRRDASIRQSRGCSNMSKNKPAQRKSA